MNQETAVFCDEPGKSILEYDEEGSISPEADREAGLCLPGHVAESMHRKHARRARKEKTLQLSDL